MNARAPTQGGAHPGHGGGQRVDALVVAGLARHPWEHGAQVGIGPEAAYPAGLAGVAQQGLHDRKRDDLGVAGHRSDTDLWAWWQDLGMVLQQVIDSDVQCGGEGLQAGVHERAVLPSRSGEIWSNTTDPARPSPHCPAPTPTHTPLDLI